jgi:hypothetical protein
MKTSRIQLRDTALQEGIRLLEITKLGSMAELMSVLLFRYGHHLEATWVVLPTPDAHLTVTDPSPSDFQLEETSD